MHVDLLVLEPLLEVVVDALIADGAQQRHVADAGLLLLEAVLPVGLAKRNQRDRPVSRCTK
jgi:hypothetical protein